MRLRLRRLFHRKRIAPHAGPQGEDYEALQMERQSRDDRDRFAENVIRKVGQRDHPFLDDPFG